MKTWKFDVILTALVLATYSSIGAAQSQASMNKEACDEYAKADGELNGIYQSVLREHRGDALFLRKMRAAQRYWVTYRDAHLAAIYPAADTRSEYGSVYPMCRCTALAEVTRKRTEDLRRWANGAPEGDVCVGSTGKTSSEDPSAGVPEHERLDSVFRKRWTLTQMGERSFTRTEPYLEFDVKQGRFSGSGGCNRIFGGYNVDGTNLKFTAVASTKRACLDAGAQQVETGFLKALERTNRIEIQGNVIRLHATGSPILTFNASEREPGPVRKTTTVTGTVTYRQRIALSPNAVVQVKLLDVSRADAPAVTIAEQTIRPAGQQVPIKFKIRYDPGHIDQRHRYTIQARILEEGKLRFINSQAYPVITGGNPSTVEVTVNPVR
jgi:uncharacterized lipoprotein YbaY/uncharacterized protein YecT (DUF1311 family)